MTEEILKLPNTKLDDLNDIECTVLDHYQADDYIKVAFCYEESPTQKHIFDIKTALKTLIETEYPELTGTLIRKAKSLTIHPTNPNQQRGKIYSCRIGRLQYQRFKTWM